MNAIKDAPFVSIPRKTLVGLVGVFKSCSPLARWRLVPRTHCDLRSLMFSWLWLGIFTPHRVIIADVLTANTCVILEASRRSAVYYLCFSRARRVRKVPLPRHAGWSGARSGARSGAGSGTSSMKEIICIIGVSYSKRKKQSPTQIKSFETYLVQVRHQGRSGRLQRCRWRSSKLGLCCRHRWRHTCCRRNTPVSRWCSLKERRG
jgi:hypothetical protein